MRKYRFRLDSVLRVRRIQEEIAKKDLGEARRQEVQAEAHLGERLERFHGLPSAQAPETVDEFRRRVARATAGAAAVAAARADYQMSVEVTASRRARWSEAQSKVKSVERLDERDREEHEQAVRAEEQKELDDRASRSRPLDDGEAR